jgi:hypothetical protein
MFYKIDSKTRIKSQNKHKNEQTSRKKEDLKGDQAG